MTRALVCQASVDPLDQILSAGTPWAACPIASLMSCLAKAA